MELVQEAGWGGGGIQEMKREVEKYKESRNDRAKPRSGQKTKGGVMETRVGKYDERKIKEEPKQGQTDRRQGRKKTGGSTFVSGR